MLSARRGVLGYVKAICYGSTRVPSHAARPHGVLGSHGGAAGLSSQSHRPSTCASAASVWGSQKVMSMARYSVDSGGQLGAGLLPLAVGHTACRGPGGSGPGAGACRAPRPGPGPAGSGLRPARPPGDRDAGNVAEEAQRIAPGGPVPGGYGRGRGAARRSALRLVHDGQPSS